MVTAPITVTVSPRQTAAVLASPLSVVMLVSHEANVVPPVNAIAVVDDSDPTGSLGPTTTKARQVYDRIEAKSNVHVAVIPFDATNPAVNGPAALDALLNADERAKLYAVSPYGVDVVLAYDYTGRASGASAILSKLETVCADPKVDAMFIVDGYLAGSPLTSTQAQALNWGTQNGNRHDGIAVTNGGDVGGSFEYGSVEVCAHICQYSAQRGIGVHPFNLSDPLTGVGTPSPQRAFDIHDGSASAEVLDNAGLTSLITFDGVDYIWGGKTTYAATDPRHWWGNAMVVKRIRKRSSQLMAPYYGVRATDAALAQMRFSLEGSLAGEFGPFVQQIEVGTPVLSGNRARIPGRARFDGFIEGVDFETIIAIGAP